MTDEHAVVGRPRRTPAEVEQIVHAFEESGLNRSQFCGREGLKLITLNRYLKRVRDKEKDTGGGANLVAVELRGERTSVSRDADCGLSIVLANGRRVEVGISFDGPTLQRLVQTLEAL